MSLNDNFFLKQLFNQDQYFIININLFLYISKFFLFLFKE